MDRKIRWGILGAGKIAAKFATDLKLVDDAELVACASLDPERRRAFADKFAPSMVFSSYDELARCSEVDVIYVATPHAYHFQHSMLCLEQGKGVLCEKPLAMNAREVLNMMEAAARNNAFLMEAFWTRFLPQFHKVSRLIKQGEVGEIKMIHADFGFRAPDPAPQRLFDPALGGGALLDIGIYPVFLAQVLLGVPDEIHATMVPFSSGVDEQVAITMRYKRGAVANLSATFAADTPVEAMIAGTRGRIHMRNRFHNATSTIELVRQKDQIEIVEVERETGYGYQFEARHVNECIRLGLVQSPVWAHADSLSLIQILDRIRGLLNLRYPADE